MVEPIPCETGLHGKSPSTGSRVAEGECKFEQANCTLYGLISVTAKLTNPAMKSATQFDW
jgi:hypothetical protein